MQFLQKEWVENQPTPTFDKEPPHIIKSFLLKIQGFLTLSVSVNKPEL